MAGPGSQPTTYLAAPLDHYSETSNIDPSPAFGFGHGLTYTTFAWSDLVLAAPSVPTDGGVRASIVVRNTGARAGTEVVTATTAETAVMAAVRHGDPSPADDCPES